MTTIVTRAGKGAPLTNVEVDANFTNLNNDKIEKTGGTITANSSSTALTITQTGTGNAFVVEDSASPDTSPFVIDADGRVIRGTTTAQASVVQAITYTAFMQNVGVSLDASGSFNGLYANIVSGPYQAFAKSRGAGVGTHAIVSNGDALGNFSFAGSDGVAFVEAARIRAEVDGTPGTNDMPGRLVFSTTADGASLPTERMRIDSAGRVGIGTSTLGGLNGANHFSQPLTGGTAASGIRASGTIQPDVTSTGQYFRAVANVASGAAPNSVIGFIAAQGTISGSVFEMKGFQADSSLTGATNNYGFYSNIVSGTGRWNFYAAGTAENYFGGNTTISVTDNTNAALRITQLGTGNALLVEDSSNPDSTPFVIDASGQIISGATSAASVGTYYSVPTLQVLGTDTGNPKPSVGIADFSASSSGSALSLSKSRSGTRGTIGSIVSSGDALGAINFNGDDGTAMRAGAEIRAYVDGTPGTNDMPGRLVFSTTADGASSPTERMRIDSAGNVGIGGVASGGKLHVFGATDVAVVAEGQSGYGSFYAKGSGTSNSYMFFGNGGGEKGRITVDNTGAITFHNTTSSTERLRINSAGYILQTGSGPFVGMSIRNTSGSGSAASHSFVDFQNELGTTTGSIINLHTTDGSSRIDFAATPSGARNSDRRAAVFQVYGNGNVLAINPNGGLGYGTGAGGTVTQATSKSTAVTLNKPTGQITMNNAALAANTAVTFIVNNSLATASDVVIINLVGGVTSSANYRVENENINAGLFRIRVTNISAGSLSEAVVINFAIIKGAAA